MHQIIAGAGVIAIDEEVIGLVGELQDVLNGEGQFIEAAADQIEQRVLQDCYIIQLPFPVLINDERGGIYPKRVKDFLDDSEV